MKLIAALVFTFTLLVVSGGAARAECNCVAVAGDVSAEVQGMAARADSLYVRGDYEGALALYADAFASSSDSALLYAQGMCRWQLGDDDDAAAMFAAYLDADGKLAYRDRAEEALEDVKGGVAAGGGGVVGGVVGGVGGLVGGVGGAVGGTVDDVGGTGTGLVGGLTNKAPKPKKVAKGAAMLLGVVAVVALGAVAIHGIYAGIKDDVDVDGVDKVKFDKKFGIGMALAGVVVGGTAIYLYGLTAATGAVGAGCSGTF